jgi:hypothetical protein
MGTIALTRAAIPAWVGHLHEAKDRFDRCVPCILICVLTTAIGTGALLFEKFVRLLRDYNILHSRQHRFPLTQTHAQCFHGQLIPLDR